MWLKPILFTAYLAAVCLASVDELIPGSDEFINHINTVQSSWVAERNSLSLMSPEQLKCRFGVLPMADEHLKELAPNPEWNQDLPENFDSREKWPECPSIKEIRDQGACGSCWAFGAVSAITDRICIASRGEKQVEISADDLLSCCKDCGHGCNGGSSPKAWKYWVEKGIVSGGSYGSNQGCRPYEIAPFEHHMNGTRPPSNATLDTTPQCLKQCQNANYEKSYEDDLNYGMAVYSLPPDEQSIMAEIFQHGPVEAGFAVYSDFHSYKSGVYKQVTGESVSRHAVRMLGWGVDEKTKDKYWLLANSWSSDWGEGGTFRMLRGTDECGIEVSIVGGIPLL